VIILGINAYHGDASACLLQDGLLVAAAEEERFNRIKHWAGFPAQAIQYCLREAGVGLSDVDFAAINRDPKANIWKKFRYTLSKRPDLSHVLDRLKNAKKWARVEDELTKFLPGQAFHGKVLHIEHHLAHLASTFLVSPFDEAVALSVDGFGDFASAAWGVGKGTTIRVEDKVYFPHSLGVFYQAITQFLGFPHYGDEYKVMGLAPYGQPHHLDKMRQIVSLQADGTFRLNLDFFRHHKEKIDYEWNNGSPRVGTLFTPALEELLGKARDGKGELTQHHKDIARSAQRMYEDAFFHLANTLHAHHKVDALVLAGGCAMNSPFKKMYIQSAAGDAGGAIGAAFVAWHQENNGARRNFVMNHAYWGPQFSESDIKQILESHHQALAQENCTMLHLKEEHDICRKSAQAVADGKVVGWFQGRMEWGPRALGNRSIIGDPRRKDMKDILNLKIKRRESFRPFAPSILRDAVPEWFATDDDVPFMMQVFQIREDKRGAIPAVTHVDGSGRLQTVYRETNPIYYDLIAAFRDITGVPIVLNTSFNENEPVVCTPQEALDCFLRTKMDVLVLGNFFIERTAQ
jgi:carbamoyltransferase